VQWIDDWPVIGEDSDGDGTGEPVASWKKPATGFEDKTARIASSDEFNSPEKGLQWQWHANPRPEWMFMSGSQGFMRLYCNYTEGRNPNLWNVPNLYLQKFPADEFTVTARVDFQPKMEGDRCGLVVMGMDYSTLVLEQISGDIHYYMETRLDADSDGESSSTLPLKSGTGSLYLRVKVSGSAICSFSISTDGQEFAGLGDPFHAVKGRWIGAKVGLFALGSEGTNDTGWADFDWFRITR
jgi:beta-xylosidase